MSRWKIPEVGDWSEEKYDLVACYAQLFTRAMRQRWDRLVYLDLFCGPGRSRVRGTDRIIEGPPLRALALDPGFDRFVFCDADESKIDALRERIEERYPDSDVRYYIEDTNAVAESFLNDIRRPASSRKVLAFCFLDPYRLKNLHFGTIETLAERLVDFLVLIPSGMDANRNVNHYVKSESAVIDLFLGDPDWRDQWKAAAHEGTGFVEFLTGAFGQRMAELDYKFPEVTTTHLIRGGRKNLPLYRLAFFSRHPLGNKFWSECRRYSSDQRKLF